MFEEHLKFHPKFTPDEDFPIAQCKAHSPISANMKTYADVIKQMLPTLPNMK